MSVTAIRTRDRAALSVPLAFLAIYLIWGTTYLAIRLAVETIPPFLMAGTRFLLAGTATFLFLWARGVRPPTRLQWRSVVVVGGFLLVGGNGFVTWSEQSVPSGIAALVVATVPLWMTLLDWVIFRSGRPGKGTVVGLLLGFVGIGLLIGPGQLVETHGIQPLHLAVLLLAPILWSLGSLYSRQAKLPENVFMSTAAEMLAGGVLLMIAGLVTGEAGRLDVADVSAQSLIAMLYLAVFGSVVALTAYVWLLKRVQATRVATYTYVNPIIAVFLGWLILSEALTPQMLVAIVIIILAVVLITAQKQEEPENEEPNTQAVAQVAPCESLGV